MAAWRYITIMKKKLSKVTNLFYELRNQTESVVVGQNHMSVLPS